VLKDQRFNSNGLIAAKVSTVASAISC